MKFSTTHDVLASAILDWRLRHVQAQERTEAEKRAALEAAEREHEAAHQRELKAAQELAQAQAERAEIAERHVKEQAKARSNLRRLAILALGAALLALGMLFLTQKQQQRIERLDSALTMVINLNGTWSCNDGGTYTIHQEGRKVSWIGGRPPVFRNSFDGSITDEGYIEGSFQDLPGYRDYNSGPLTLRIEGPNRLVRVSERTKFGGTIWTKQGSFDEKSAPTTDKANVP
jgi:hypothetical protein